MGPLWLGVGVILGIIILRAIFFDRPEEQTTRRKPTFR